MISGSRNGTMGRRESQNLPHPRAPSDPQFVSKDENDDEDEVLIAEVFHDRFRPRMDVQFVVNIFQVGTDRFEANGQGVGNFLVTVAFGQEP